MKIFTWSNIRLVLIAGLVIFLFSFASHRNSARKITKTQVIFLDKTTLFLNDSMVNKLLIEKKGNSKTINKEEVDLKSVENRIKKHGLIQQANAFLTVEGVLKVKVKEKVPVGRCFKESSSFYIDNKGDVMPLSENYTARVPLIFGEINWVDKNDLSKILNMIAEDDFLKKNIISIQIFPKGELLLSNRSYDFQIEFGKLIDVERKFKNYKTFYQNTVLDSTLQKYRRINLKFANQVVGIK